MSTDVTTGFDHHSPEFRDQRLAQYAELRSRCPVAHSDAHGGFTVVSSYEGVGEAARDDARFSSAQESLLIPTNQARTLLPIQVDPPELARYRSLISPFLTPRAVKHHEAAITADVQAAIAELVAADGGDVVRQLCAVVPTRATMRLIGLAPEDWETFAGPLHTSAFSVPGSPEQLAAIRRIHAFDDIVEAEVDARIAERRGDLISSLLDAEFEGVPTTREEVVNLVRMLIFGGMDTVSAALSNILAVLAQRADLRAFLVEDLSRLGRAIEEFLRYEAPIQGFARKVTQDTTITGCPVAQDDWVFLVWGSANHDEAEFDQPGELDLARFPNRHYTFGTGEHRCMGSTLARTEMRIILSAFLTAIPEFELTEPGVVEPATIGQILGKREVHIRIGTP